MPSTVNGIGTWYYGKDNLVTRDDTCGFCHAYGELKSYDTTLYFVVVFIPLIPLGRKRVIDECSRCKRHRAAKLAEWEKRKGEAILQATEAWQAQRGDKQKAIDAVGATIAFHDIESFHHLAGVIGQAFARDADVQMFLGSAYEHFGEMQPAETAFRAAVINQPDEKSKEALARFFIRQIRPTDAEPLLAHVLPGKKRDKATMLLALAETYQAVGDHESAYRIVDEVGTTFPDMLSEPGFEKLRRSVSKYRGTNKPIKSAEIERARRQGARQTSWFTRNRGAVIAGGVFAALAAWYLGAAITGTRHSVSLVNGTQTPYSVVINGQSYAVPAMDRRAVDLTEGALNVSVPELKGAVEAAKLEMRTNFWRRPFEHRNFVINPDRLGLVVWSETQYGSGPKNNEKQPHQLHVGQAIYDLDKVDYLFEPFPQSIKSSEDGGTIKKTRIDMIRNLSPVVAAQFLKMDLGAAPATEWAKRFASLGGDETTAVAVLANVLAPADEIAFLRSHLSDRPVRIDWHRRYQGLVQVEQPNFDLVGEYRALSAKDPSDSVMTYLLGRVLDERDEALALFRKAAEGPSPCAYASYALAHDAILTGDYERSLALMQTALKQSPKNLTFRTAQLDALEAMNRIDEARTAVIELQKQMPEDPDLVWSEVRLLVKKGDVPAARARIDSFCQELSKDQWSDESIAVARHAGEAGMFYATGDLAECAKALKSVKTPATDFKAAIIEGKPEIAQQALVQVKGSDSPASDYLLLSLCAKRAGRGEIADLAWIKALDLMRTKGGRDDRILAQHLSSSDPPTDRALRNWVASPGDRAIMFAAMGVRYPHKQAEYFAQAKKLNYSNKFPSHLIAQVTK